MNSVITDFKIGNGPINGKKEHIPGWKDGKYKGREMWTCIVMFREEYMAKSK